jgi:hypothetical protein
LYFCSDIRIRESYRNSYEGYMKKTVALLLVFVSVVAIGFTSAFAQAKTISQTSGDGQTSAILTSLSQPFVVTVTDSLGNPVSGVAVDFTIASVPPGATGQSLSVTSTNTDLNGRASSTLTLGSIVGTYTVSATSAGLVGSPVGFSATSVAGPAKNISMTSGDGQSGQVTTALANPFVVTVTDVGGNPVKGQKVTFVIASVPTGATGQTLSAKDVNTNSLGESSSSLTLGTKSGTYTVTATSSGLTGSPVIFTATGTAGPATQVRVETLADGSGTVVLPQNLASGSSLTVYSNTRDANDNFVANVAADAWAVINPTGGVTGTDLVPSGDSKSATFTGHLVGAGQIQATEGSLTSVVSGAITVIAGTPTKIRVETKADGTGKVVPDTSLLSGSSMTVYAISRDALNNFVANIAASWSLISTTGGVVSGDLVSGGASAVFTGHVIGTTQIRATSGALTPTTSGTVAVTVGPAAKVRVETRADGAGKVVPDTTLPSGSALTVYSITRDASDNFVANVAATAWSLTSKVPSTGGVANADLVPSGDMKSAVFTGHLIGTAKIQATSGALAVVTSGVISVTAGPAVSLRVETRADGTGTILPAEGLASGAKDTAFAITRDASGNFVANVGADSWSLVNITGGVVSGDLVPSGDRKSAIFTAHATGSAQIHATYGALPVTNSGTITVTVGTATKIRVETKADGTGIIVPDQTLLASRSVTVYAVSRDSANNFIANVPASTWSLQNKTSGVADSDLVVASDKKSAVFTGHAPGSARIQATLTGLTPTTSGMITVALGTPATVRVETKSDGTGIIVPAQSIMASRSITVYAISRDSSNNFLANVAASTWSMQNITGGVADSNLSASPDMKSAVFTAGIIGSGQIRATATGLTPVPSGVLTVTLGTTAKVRVETKGDGTGVVVPAQAIGSGDSLQVYAVTRDSANNFVANVAADIWSLPVHTGGVLLTDLVPSADRKSAWFKALGLGTAQIQATSGALQVVPSGLLTIGVGSATQLVFYQQPSTVVSQVVMSPPVTVRIQDAGGNLVTADTRNVTLALLNNPAGGTLSGTTTVAAAGGVATFSNLTVDKADSTYTLRASSTPALVAATSSPFIVLPGILDHFTVEASGGGQIPSQNAGVPFDVRISARDLAGNVVRSFTGTVLVSAGGGGVLGTGGGTTLAFTNGVLAAHTISFDNIGTFSLNVRNSAGFESGASNTFQVTAGPPGKLAFVQQPTNAIAGTNITPAITVQLQDALGNNIAQANLPVTIDLLSGTGLLSGTKTRNTNTSGIASFANLSIDSAGAKVLRGNSGTLTPAISDTFLITAGSAAKLAFTVNPGTGTAGLPLSVQPVVTLQDQFGNTVTGVPESATLALQNNPGAGTLGGTRTVPINTATGQAVFTDISVDKVGSGYTLTATGQSVSTTPGVVVSLPFNVNSGTAAKLNFSVQPSNTVAGEVINPAVVVQVQDVYGNLVSINDTLITLSMDSTGSLGGNVTRPTIAGSATFNDLRIDKVGTKILKAAATGLTGAFSAPFTISPAAAGKLAFTTQPGGGVAGQPLSPQPVVTLQDAFGNTVKGVAQSVSISLKDTVSAGAKLHGFTTMPVDPVTGLATFTTLSIDKSGVGFTLTAIGSTVDTARGVVVSQPLTVTAGAAKKLKIETLADGKGSLLVAQNVSSGVPISVYAISRDSLDNFVANVAADQWTLVDTAGGAKLTDLVVAGDKKSAVFTGGTIGSSARIFAAAVGLTPDTSGLLSVVQPGAPTKIIVETAPNGTGTIVPAQTITSGGSITVYAVERDAADNFVANIPAESWSVDVVSGGIMAGDLVPAGDKKSAIFTAHRIGKARLVASLGALTSVPSDTIRVSAGTPVSIAVASKSPDSARVDMYFGSSLVSVVKDSAGNPVRNVLVTYSAPSTGPSSLFDGAIHTATTDSLGLATSKPLKANTVIGQYTDTARVAGITGQALFVLRNLAGFPKTTTAVSGTPQTTSVATAFPLPMTVAVRDSFGNPADSVRVLFSAPTSGPSGTFLGGVFTNAVYTNTQGVATSTVFVANLQAGSYTVNATVAGASTPATFSMTNTSGSPGSVTATAGTPQSAQVGTPFATRFKALVKDPAGNVVSNVIVHFTAPSTGSSGTFPGGLSDTSRTDSSGIATAPLFTADTVAGTYNVLATVDTMAGSAKFALTNLAGPVDTFYVQAASGGDIGTQIAQVPFPIKIIAKDSYNNVATGFVGTVTITANHSLLSGGGKTASFVAGVLDSLSIRTAVADTSFVLTATRTGGAETGKSNSFQVLNPAPIVKNITPSSGLQGQTLDILILGGGFISGVTSVTFGDQITTSTTVTSDSTMTVRITIDPAALLGPRNVTVFNAPPGGSPPYIVMGGFVVGTIPAPTVTSIAPNTGAQLQSLHAVIRGTNFLGGGVSQVGFVPATGMTVDSIVVDNSTQISMRLTIGPSAAIGPHDVVVWNVATPPAGGTDTLRGAFTVSKSDLAIPVLLSPPDSSQNQPSTLTLIWQSAFGATSYDLQVATGPTFSGNLVVSDSVLAATSRQIGPLTLATNYYWHVRSRNSNGVSAWSTTWMFSNTPFYPDHYTLNDTVYFPFHENIADYGSQDYQLVGLPGDSKASVSTFMAGTAGTNWQAYWDNGAQTNYLVPFSEGDSRFTFSAGNGFWLINQGPWIVANRDVPTAPLHASTSAVHVKIHSGWNIISNPFISPALWKTVQDANGGLQPLWAWITDNGGNKLWVYSTYANPYTGYYLYNSPDPNPIDSLKFPFGSTVKKTSALAEVDSGAWKLSVDLRQGKYADYTTILGVSPAATDGKDRLDYNKPRPFGDQPGTYFDHPDWDRYCSSFATDIRAPLTKIGIWELTVSSAGPKAGSSELDFRGLENVPAAFGVYLVDEAGACYRNLREEGTTYKFVPAGPKTLFKIMIGTKEALEQEVAKVVPRAFALEQNYPNPFNPSTTIPVSVPFAADVTLKIYNILGEEVATVFSGMLDQGRHRFTWEGRNSAGAPVASGVYFVRLTTVTGQSFVGKMLLMK